MRKFTLCVIAAVVAVGVISCAQGNRVRPEAIEPPRDLGGQYILYLYGLRHDWDLEAFAFLDIEGDDTRIALRTYPRDYRVVAGISGSDGIAIAKRFFDTFRPYHRVSFRKIVDAEGRTVGYEIQPLYLRSLNDNPQVYSAYYYEKGEGLVEIRFYEPDIEPGLLWGK